jgi:hypothetical protein
MSHRNEIIETFKHNNRTYHILKIPSSRFDLINPECGSGTLAFSIGVTNYTIKIASSQRPPNDIYLEEGKINYCFVAVSRSVYIVVGVGPTRSYKKN